MSNDDSGPDGDARAYTADQALRRREEILLAIGFAAEKFLGHEPIGHVMQEVLERLGRAAGAEGATVFQFIDDPHQGKRLMPQYSWAVPGQPTFMSMAEEGIAAADKELETLYTRLARGEAIVAQIAQLPARLQSVLAGHHILALAALPVFTEGRLAGAIAVSQRTPHPLWSTSEISALKAAAAVIGAALERTRNRRAVRDRDTLLRILIDSTRIMVGFFDRTLRCRFANPHFQDFFGRKDQTVIGCSLKELLGPETFRHNENLWQSVFAGTIAQVFESAHTGPDGRLHHLETRVVPYPGAQGETIGCYVLYTDISERKCAEEALRQAHDQLEKKVHERTEELAMVNRDLEAYSYTVSHDLRAPLRAIDGFTHLLAEQLAGRLDKDSEKYFGRIRNAIQRMFWLIEGLLELGRISRKDIEARRIDLSLYAREVIEDLAAGNPARQVDWHIEDGLYAVGDRQLVRMLLQNLLENAWKYTAKKTAVRIEFGALPGLAGLRRFHITDNGAGFDMAQAGKLFLPFQRLHSEHDFEGSGIGLATVARIVQRHGGTIHAEGRVGEGATFSFTLPG